MLTKKGQRRALCKRRFVNCSQESAVSALASTIWILDGKQHLFEGICKGEIIKEKRGSAGFGYDPIFVPEGYNESFAQLGNAVKNKISHRAKAVEMLCKYLKK